LARISDQDIQDELDRLEPGLDLLQDLGFNIVRLVVMWKGIEPRKGRISAEYLRYVGKIIDALYARNLFVFIDFHQDLAHDFYGGDGFPDWALRELNTQPPQSVPPPNKYWQLEYVNNQSLQTTYKNFWANSNGVRDRLTETIKRTAREFRGNLAVLGYELFNEPGSLGLPGSPVIQNFETQRLLPYYSETIRKIREEDRNAFVFIEPDVNWTLTSPIATQLDPSQISDDRIVFSFHYYDGSTITLGHGGIPDISFAINPNKWEREFQDILSDPDVRKAVPFLTEFGGSQDWSGGLFNYAQPDKWSNQIRFYMDRQFHQVEKHLLNATYWCYDLYNTPAGKDNWNEENFSILGPGLTVRNLDIVARPYPLRSSGKPSLLYFDIENRHCVIELDGPVVDEPTVVYIPVGRGFAYRQFDALATSEFLHWDRANKLLYWKPSKDLSVNQLIICPRRGFEPGVLPEEIQKRLSLGLQYRLSV
jgi:hypothetical protein